MILESMLAGGVVFFVGFLAGTWFSYRWLCR